MLEKAVMERATEPPPPDKQDWSGGWPQTPDQFEELVEAFQDRLVWYAYRRLGELPEAEDAVQEVFSRAYASRKKLRAIEHVGPYLYRMAANECTDRLRRRGRRVISIEMIRAEDVPDGRPAADERLAADDELRRIEQLLESLPRRQAEAVRLRVLDELSLADAAGVLGCPLPTLKSRLHHGLKKLRRLISRSKEVPR
jgi:RNA polymerase sigma-70 factor (ECF subfamily)